MMFNGKTLVSLALAGVMMLTTNSAIVETSDVDNVYAVVKSYEPHTKVVTMIDTTGAEWVFEDCQIKIDDNDIYEITYFSNSYEPIAIANRQEGTTWNLLND